MKNVLELEVLRQPDDVTCGPTCLEAIYRYYNDRLPLKQIIEEVPQLETGGTLAALLAIHALKRGYRATIYTYNLQMFDPTWFTWPSPPNLRQKLASQMEVKTSPQLRYASKAYIDFLDLGGEIRFADLTPGLIRKYLKRDIPILTGLSSTYLYRCAREVGIHGEFDDVRGNPSGHFVILCGYDKEKREVLVADPWAPSSQIGKKYTVLLERVVGAVLLGVVTYDANMLILEPPHRKAAPSDD